MSAQCVECASIAFMLGIFIGLVIYVVFTPKEVRAFEQLHFAKLSYAVKSEQLRKAREEAERLGVTSTANPVSEPK